ncbi:MAG TPA: DUF2867 domain-containing protein [Dehalococcoidia bacterium]|nr:DUF2867 domain-containing protein [Dehalococcoidia bacterium]
MAGSGDFEEADRKAAQNMAEAARQAGVRRIVYLGGLGREDRELSPHLASRAEVGRVLGSTGIRVTTLRAAIILGAGGASYEMLRNLVERLPVMVTPRWVSTRTQPIAADDVIRYLAECIEVAETAGLELDIGGPEIMTYREMMERFAAVERKRRWIIDVPVLTPRLSSYWVNLMTPIPASVARPLVDGLRNETVVRDTRARELMPFELTPYETGVRKALREALPERLASGDVVGILPEVANEAYDLGFDPRQPGVALEARGLVVRGSEERTWDVVSSIGGKNGWYFADWAWTFRGWMDALVGGIGNRRERPAMLKVGDRLDTWEVERYVEGRDLVLRTRMRIPRLARQGLHVRPHPLGSLLLQYVEFHPTLVTWVYWWALYPAHRLIFRGLLRAIAVRAHRKKEKAVHANA